MDNLRHLFPKETATSEKYVSPNQGRDNFVIPPRDAAAVHGKKLVSDVENARVEADTASSVAREKGIILEFASEPEYDLYLKSLEARASGIELLSVKNVGKVMKATVFVPYEKIGRFIKKLESYTSEVTREKGNPKNQKLAESISSIRLATIETLWTDYLAIPGLDVTHWFELWLRTSDRDGVTEFHKRADSIGLLIRNRILFFPDRAIVVGSASLNQLLQVPGLFDFLAEIRFAKALSGDYMTLNPASQREFVESLLDRIEGEPQVGPSVCHLDTGIHFGHPLLKIAVLEEHVIAVDPNWTAADVRGHGTEMAGLALLGCLTEVLNTDETILLNHCIESVKLLPNQGNNDPDLYGDLTSQAVSRIEIAAPTRTARVFCLTITADDRDGCFPSSWSAAIDQICASRDGETFVSQLFIVSAGNVDLADQHEYPNINYEESVEDPAQSWNALTVGAYTNKTQIEQIGYEGWSSIAERDRLSPSSRTSRAWADKSWPIKPDIVMEGGNSAIDPATKKADSVDDLSLLTTRVSPAGAMLTTTGDTSGAAALASRYAAKLWAAYPGLWPETIRGLLVHSARWKPAMLDEFPYAQRHDRLRVYGFGVPDLKRALSSANREATQIIESELQPFHIESGKCKTKDMHLHSLPWPKEELESLGEAEVTLRVTLSYFIEPSPGRRGWTIRSRYQSFGLRYQVKRPLETLDDFKGRISRASREEDETYSPAGSDGREWTIGSQLRARGSIHSDSWTGTAAELANCGMLAVFPVTGWWKERPHLEGWKKSARYSLIISLESSIEADLYTPIANKIGVPVKILV